MTTQYAGEFDLDVCTLITSKGGLWTCVSGISGDFFEELEKNLSDGSLTVRHKQSTY